MRRSAVPIPGNIAEGCGRNSTLDYVRFLQIACGSLFELHIQLEISGNLSYMEQSEVQTMLSICNEIERMLVTLIKNLTRTP